MQGLLFGFGAAVPIGPINIMIMTAALKSFLMAFAIGLGAMSADIFYLVLLAFGLLEYLNGDIASKTIGTFGVCYLFYISYMIIKNSNQPIKADEHIVVARGNFLKNYFKGFLATLANPYTTGFWLSVASYVKSFENVYVVVAGLVVAIFLWILSMPFVVYKSAKFISYNLVRRMNLICAIILVGFSLNLFYKLFLH
ncbi:LysE family translocator [Campylobacter sp. RM16192]|uniref:LysE family translocator n=1 Tax=Campylobacter sp. RM16192 TaxID=1660080 RepID=UPI001557F929|nr:LysE family transporter [Campylobacter sp. RM16192]